ncbi:hypothetical protein AXG93_167s1190 [Marchantia polymorpha subsp. ruderalis]|uniref:PDZ domain-containing protein n=1 Tax=Marchantia polymorpha subsp. ruderalis TaxID=1480154 RepID=A0A176WN85_MARPO|nr:hypothetical protein AXG93_167s1190 [Marchantia polymorpha subsp. ruderalis]
MASMASSRAGCRWTSPAVAPARDSVVAAQSRRFSLFSSTSGAGVFGVPCRTSKKLVRAKLLVAREQIFPHSNGFSSSLARCALIDNSQPNAAGGSEVCHELPTAIWERTGIVFGKIKQFAAIVLVASSFQLFCNEFVLALEFGTNNSEQGTVNAASTNVSSGEFSQQFGAPLSVDINSSTEVTSLPSDVTTDSSSQVRSVSSSLDTGEGLPSSQPSAEIGRPAELSNPECSTSSMAVLEEEAGRSSEPVTNESVVEEAWEVVNENFLDARRHSWSAEDWLRQKEDVLKRPIRSRMAAYGAIRSMLATLNDPYTRFLTPDQFLQLSKYDVTGVGLNIGEIEVNGTTSLRVLGIVLGSPAQTMGVRQGDELIAVNGTAVRGMSAFEAASLIQGPKGTPVTIQIRHGPCEEVQNLTVPREQDVRTPVFYRLERTQNPRQLMGYIRLKEFNALAKRDLVTAMKRLQDAGATSFLLDLQDNPGGLVQAGIEIARLFLDGGETVIQTVGRDPTIFKNIMASGVALTKAPLMVAAALHDNCRAVLVGNRTFGKGLIQSVYELSDGSGIILTVGKYVTPGHIDIDGNGIEPDFRNPPGLSEAMEKLGACELKLKSVSSISTQTS